MQRDTANSRPQISVIFPCYNEEKRLPASLARVRQYLNDRGWSYEILVVDDGSTDGTAAAAETAAAGDGRVRVLRYEQNQGKGHAVAYGGRHATGERVLFSDADLSTPIEELEKFLPYLEQGFDVVIGSRALKESVLKVHQPWWRERAGRLMNLLIRKASGVKFADTQCGFKLFSRRAARDIFPALTVHRWVFDVEILILAQKLDYRVRDVPVTWINSGDSRVKLSHTPNILSELWRIRLYWRTRKPERQRVDDAEVVTQPAP